MGEGVGVSVVEWACAFSHTLPCCVHALCTHGCCQRTAPCSWPLHLSCSIMYSGPICKRCQPCALPQASRPSLHALQLLLNFRSMLTHAHKHARMHARLHVRSTHARMRAHTRTHTRLCPQVGGIARMLLTPRTLNPNHRDWLAIRLMSQVCGYFLHTITYIHSCTHTFLHSLSTHSFHSVFRCFADADCHVLPEPHRVQLPSCTVAFLSRMKVPVGQGRGKGMLHICQLSLCDSTSMGL